MSYFYEHGAEESIHAVSVRIGFKIFSLIHDGRNDRLRGAYLVKISVAAKKIFDIFFILFLYDGACAVNDNPSLFYIYG